MGCFWIYFKAVGLVLYLCGVWLWSSPCWYHMDDDSVGGHREVSHGWQSNFGVKLPTFCQPSGLTPLQSSAALLTLLFQVDICVKILAQGLVNGLHAAEFDSEGFLLINFIFILIWVAFWRLWTVLCLDNCIGFWRICSSLGCTMESQTGLCWKRP